MPCAAGSSKNPNPNCYVLNFHSVVLFCKSHITRASRARHGGASGRATGAVMKTIGQIGDFMAQNRGLLSLSFTTIRGLVHPEDGPRRERGIFYILS